MKQCAKCRLQLPTTEFYVISNGVIQSACKRCQKKSVAEWRSKNRSRHNANARRWREANPEKVKQTNRETHQRHKAEYAKLRHAWSAANPQKRRDAERRWRSKPESKEIQRLRSRRFRANNKTSTASAERRWRQKNPHKVCSYAKTRRARKAGAPINDFTAEQWIALQIAFNYRCAYCDKRRKGRLTQDHVVPLSKGGAHTAANIVPSCGPCNSTKHTGPPLRPVQVPLL